MNKQEKAFEGFAGLFSAVTEQRKHWYGHLQFTTELPIFEQIRHAFLSCALNNRICCYFGEVSYETSPIPWESAKNKLKEIFSNQLFDSQDECIYYSDTTCVILTAVVYKTDIVPFAEIFSLSKDALDKTIAWLSHEESPTGTK